MIIEHVSTINCIYQILSYISDTLNSGSSDTQMDSDWLLIILQFYCLNLVSHYFKNFVELTYKQDNILYVHLSVIICTNVCHYYPECH